MTNTSNSGRVSGCCVLLAGFLVAGCLGGGYGDRNDRATERAAEPWARGLWVSRFEWRSDVQIAQIMEDAASAGLTDVFFQVRGNGTVFYESRHEPWSETFGYRSPGFDPLASAIREARARGLRLHAWINTLPGWRGDVTKADTRQLVRARPEWFFRKDGAPIALESRYYWLDPANPSVREHVVQLCRELVRNYAVDGVHLDHVRCPDGYANPSAVTLLVREVRTMLRGERRAPALSVAVFADPDRALERVGQDWGAWAREGLVDALLQMNYTENDELFAQRARTAVSLGHGVPVVVGVGVHKLRGPHQAVAQAASASASGATGFCLFSHGAVFAGDDGGRDYARVLRDLD